MSLIVFDIYKYAIFQLLKKKKEKIPNSILTSPPDKPFLFLSSCTPLPLRLLIRRGARGGRGLRVLIPTLHPRVYYVPKGVSSSNCRRWTTCYISIQTTSDIWAKHSLDKATHTHTYLHIRIKRDTWIITAQTSKKKGEIFPVGILSSTQCSLCILLCWLLFHIHNASPRPQRDKANY